MTRSGIHRAWASARLVTKDLVRNRVAVSLLFVIPTVFYLLIHATTRRRDIQFQLSTLGQELLSASERDLSMLFMGMASISGLSAFLSFILVHRPAGADRRLVFEGYRPAELLAAKVVVMAGVSTLVALYVTGLLPFFFRPGRPIGVFLGFLLTSVVYGVLGLAVGAVVRRELEGMLFILLLVNVDAGWLQNPVFYAHAENQQLLRILPGHYPGQVAMLSAFTDRGLLEPTGMALGYAAAGLAVASVLYWLRVRVHR